jgi:hypothetical protein
MTMHFFQIFDKTVLIRYNCLKPSGIAGVIRR